MFLSALLKQNDRRSNSFNTLKQQKLSTKNNTKSMEIFKRYCNCGYGTLSCTVEPIKYFNIG